jgi:membrane fusion protein, multidrug efflux system
MRGLNLIPILLALAASAAAQPVDAVRVVARPVDRTVVLPGEFIPYLSVPIHAKVAGFVDKVNVDRGSPVKEGELLATMTAPELNAQLAEAVAKVRAAEAQRVQAEAQRVEAQARVVAAESTYQRMKAASATEGAIAGNELVQAQKEVDAERAKVQALEGAVQAAQAAVQAAQAVVKASEDVQAYLRVTAPFAGVITARNVHPGALVGTGESSVPMFQLETVNRLRLVVPVPEVDVGGIVHGAKVAFTVPAYPTETFYGTVARVARSLDPKTRSMPVELEVANPQGRLAPGMYPAVKWPVRGRQQVLLVPPTAVVNTSERMFVIRVQDGRAEWVDVKRGPAQGDLVEVMGPLAAGDVLVRRGTDELRAGAKVDAKVK